MVQSVLAFVLFVFNLADVHHVVLIGYSVLLLPAMLRLLHVFEMQRTLGPIVRSIVNMAGDILTFTLIFGIMWLAFTLSFHLLFEDAPNTQASASTRPYATFFDSGLLMFSAMYAWRLRSLWLAGSVCVHCMRPALPWLSSLGDFSFANHKFTTNRPYDHAREVTGTVLFVVYLLAAAVMMLNLLVAIMSSTYE